MKLQNKQINYGPAPKALVEAVRKQLRALVETPALDEVLGQIGRFANQADDMLMYGSYVFDDGSEVSAAPKRE